MKRDRVRQFVWKWQDAVLAGALAALAVVEIWASGNSLRDRLLLTPIALVGTGALVWRRRTPLLVLVVLAVALSLGSLVVPPSGDDPIAPAIAVAVALYSVGAHTSGLRAVLGAAAMLVVVLAIVATDPDEATAGSYFFFLLVFGGPWLAGRAIRHRRLSERQLERRAVTAEREREERARRAVAEERARIARELHDVVAHAISVIVLQARGGRRSLDEPDEARRALDAIESTGTQALAEMRRLLGLLRQEDDELSLAPQPSLSSLDGLAAQVTEAGLPVEVTVEGRVRELPPGIDLSAFRIVQEALTNALKHAGPATAHVVVRYGEDELELEIVDTGPGDVAADGGGHGLLGMRERASLYGGDVKAGRRTGGGFGVRVRLPLASARL
jgi:signal transduction histidine kinase